MKELNAGMKLSGTNIKASITKRTNLLKRRHKNKLYFMKYMGFLYDCRSYTCSEKLKTVSAIPPLVLPPITQIP